MKPSPFSRKQRRRLFLFLIAIVLLLRTFTPIELNLAVGGDAYMNASGFGNLTPGHQGLNQRGTVIIWDDDKVSHTLLFGRKIHHESSITDVQIDPNQIVARCTLQNEWDWRLFVPFYKNVVAKTTGTVWYKGRIIDEIEVNCRVKLVGLFGRGYAIRKIKEVVLAELSRYLYQYTHENHSMDVFSSNINCDAIIGFDYPFFPDSLFQSAPKKTYYCLKKGTDLWSDTIGYYSFGLFDDSFTDKSDRREDEANLWNRMLAYEVTTFDRQLQTIEHKKFYQDGKLFMCLNIWKNPDDEMLLIPPDSIVQMTGRFPYRNMRPYGTNGNGEVYDHDGTLIFTIGQTDDVYQEMVQTPNGPIPKVAERRSDQYADWGTWDEEKDGWE